MNERVIFRLLDEYHNNAQFIITKYTLDGKLIANIYLGSDIVLAINLDESSSYDFLRSLDSVLTRESTRNFSFSS